MNKTPFTDQTTTKKCPAIVVSSTDYQRERSDLILIALTSQANAETDFGEMKITEWKNAGLIKPSIIKPVLQQFSCIWIKLQINFFLPLRLCAFFD